VTPFDSFVPRALVSRRLLLLEAANQLNALPLELEGFGLLDRC
jgi:hypothetical protein